MKKIIMALVVLAVIAVGTYYFVFSGGTGENPTYIPPTTNNLNTNIAIPSPQSPVVETPTTSSVSVEIKNFSFSPKTLTVKTGTKVTWTNNDSAPHTITSDSGNLLSSGTISPGQSFSFTFSNAGNVNYHCSIHPMMKGAVVVAD